MSDTRETGQDFTFTDADLDVLQQLLTEAGAEAPHAATGIRPREPGAHVPLSFAQELLWLLDRATPGLTAYNLPVARRISGALDVPSLERSLGAVVARHEVLRTRFGLVDGEPSQIVDAPAPFRLPVVDLGHLPEHDRDAEVQRLLQSRARTPFDLEYEHLFRATLIRMGDADHILLIETHHAVCDGWSVGVLFSDVASYYRSDRRGTAPELQPLPIQFGDYARWQRDVLQGENLERLLTFWRAQLSDATEPLDLPTDHPKTPDRSFVGARRSVVLSRELLSAIDQLGRRHSATRYMTLLAAYATVLHRYTGRERVLVGSASAGRMERETESLVGYFSNTLVQRADFSGDPSFAELLERVRDSALGAYDHQEVPLEKLILDLRRGDERLGDAPLFQAVFTMQDTIGSGLDLDGATARPYGVELGATKFDVTLLPSEREDGLVLTVRYASDLFASATMDRFLGHLTRVLEEAIADASRRISELPMLTDAELAQLSAWNGTQREMQALTAVHAQIAAWAARTPNAVAVICDGTQLTYAQLDARANQLARRLRRAGVEAGHVVGLHLDRSADAMVAMLAVMKAGAAYLPLSPDLPAARVADMVGDAGVRVAITTEAQRHLLPAPSDVIRVDADAASISAESDDLVALGAQSAADEIAYVLFTSGSTGVPKGVEVTHRNLAHYARAIGERLGCDAGEPFAFATVSTLAADLGHTSVFGALTTGGTLHVLPAQVATEPAAFAEYMRARRVDVLKITPSHLRALIADRSAAELRDVLPRRWVVTGGEALSWDLADRLLSAGSCRVLNHYGPTEATVGASTFEVTVESGAQAREAGAQTVPIGRPLGDAKLVILDAHAQPVPVGIPGELFIAGAGVARGYLGRTALTAERFVEVAEFGRAYRTGDRVRRLPSGDVEFLGRLDDQVKIAGFRVELGEVEQVLARHPAVAQAAAIVSVPPSRGEPALVACVVRAAANAERTAADDATPDAVLAFARERLPAYMVPGTIRFVESLPLTPNGKLDRRALAAQVVDGAGAGAPAATVAPRTEMEVALVQIWADVLKRDPATIGVHDDFLALGGNSLVAIRILGKLSRQFGVRLPLRTLFDAPSIEMSAELVEIEMKLAALNAMSPATDASAARA